jgi:hypothetical protein
MCGSVLPHCLRDQEASTLKRKKSSLSKQNTGKRKKITFSLPKGILGAGFLGALILIFILWPQPTPTSLDIAYQEDFKLTPEEKKEIQHILKEPSQKDWPQKILQKLNLEFCHLFWTGPSSLYINGKRREPVFLVEADIWRYVSLQGHVYGSPKGDDPKPILTGLFRDPKNKPLPGLDGTILLDEKDKEVIQNALTLYSGIKNLIKVSKIHFDPYLGLSVFYGDQQTKIDFGHKNFDEKTRKLKNVLEQLGQNHIQPDTIELDFLGKAFIKEKKF